MYRGTISLTHGNFKAVHWPTVVTSYKQVSLYSASRFGHELGKKRTWVGVIWQHNYEVLVHILAVMYHTYTKQNVMLMTLFLLSDLHLFYIHAHDQDLRFQELIVIIVM